MNKKSLGFKRTGNRALYQLRNRLSKEVNKVIAAQESERQMGNYGETPIITLKRMLDGNSIFSESEYNVQKAVEIHQELGSTKSYEDIRQTEFEKVFKTRMEEFQDLYKGLGFEKGMSQELKNFIGKLNVGTEQQSPVRDSDAYYESDEGRETLIKRGVGAFYAKYKPNRKLMEYMKLITEDKEFRAFVHSRDIPIGEIPNFVYYLLEQHMGENNIPNPIDLAEGNLTRFYMEFKGER